MANPIITTAAEFCRFINDLQDYYFEDFNDVLWRELWELDESVKDPVTWKVRHGKENRQFDVRKDAGGFVVWQGEGDDPSQGKDSDLGGDFENWRKNQVERTITVVVSIDRLDEITNLLKNAGLDPK
jgi:hypothetical protein